MALDQRGNLAAGTSTGGMTNKRWGRVGDSPIIGAGTYADNESCAVSATGHGEYFIRDVVAHDICALVRYTGCHARRGRRPRRDAEAGRARGRGRRDRDRRAGNIAMTFNCEGMYRGAIDAQGNMTIGICRRIEPGVVTQEADPVAAARRGRA